MKAKTALRMPHHDTKPTITRSADGRRVLVICDRGMLIGSIQRRWFKGSTLQASSRGTVRCYCGA